MKEGGRAEHGVSEGGKGRIEGGKGSEGGWVVSREGGREGGRKEGFGPGMVVHISMPVVVSIHSAMTCRREGLRAVGR